MAHRKGWSQLSPAYRKRLASAGISRHAYERGASIKGARGHTRTREHAGPSRHVKAHGSVVDQYEVGHRANGEWYYSDVMKTINRVPPSSTGMLRLAIEGELVSGPAVVHYRGKRTVEDEGGEVFEDVVGVKVSANDLRLSIERNRIGRYTVDMAAVAEELATLQWVSMQTVSIATGAPPQGKPR